MINIVECFIFSWSSGKILKILIMIYWSLGNNKEKVYLLFYITERFDVSERNYSFYCTLFRITLYVTSNHYKNYAIYYNVPYIWKNLWTAKWQSLLPYISCNGNDVNSCIVCNNIWRFSKKRKFMNYSFYRWLANF